MTEDEFRQRFGFYRRQVWWIESFRRHPGEYYRYSIYGRNGYRNNETIYWSVASLDNNAYAFALKEIPA